MAFKATFAKFDSHAAWERQKKTLRTLILRGFAHFCDTPRLKRKIRPKRARQDQHTYQLRGRKRCKTSVLAAWRRWEATLGQHTSKNLVRTPYAYACLGKKLLLARMGATILRKTI